MDKQLAQYLERMNYRGDTAPSLATLRALQRSHLASIPYENLDVLHGVPLRFETDALFEKIVTRRRGGVCYELNFLLGDMLRRMGFDLEFLSGMVAGGSGGDFSHALLLIHLPQGDYIVDVGFAKGYLTPFRLYETAWQSDGRDFYRLRAEGGWYLLEQRLPEGGAMEVYRFTLAPRRREEYRAMCDSLCASPKCKFTFMLVCSLETPEGRLVLQDRFCRLESYGGMRQTRPMSGREEIDRLLHDLYGLNERR